MKLVPLVETIDPDVKLHALAYRPSETEADKIAASTPFGDVTLRHLIQLLPDDSEYCSEGCSTCYGDTETLFDEIHYSQRQALMWANVIYDPTIRL